MLRVRALHKMGQICTAYRAREICTLVSAGVIWPSALASPAAFIARNPDMSVGIYLYRKERAEPYDVD